MSISWTSVKQKIAKDFPNIPSVTTDELERWLNESSRPNPILVDARSTKEFNVSHLPDAVHLEHTDQTIKYLNDRRNESGSKDAVVYCSVGYRSAKLVQSLVENEIVDVWNLDGSIFQWFNEGRPVFCGETSAAEVHPFNARWGRLLNKSP